MLLVGGRNITTIVYLFLLSKNSVEFTLGIGGLLFDSIRHLWRVVDDLWNPSNYESYIKPKS